MKFKKNVIIVSSNSYWNIYNFRTNLLIFLKNKGFEIVALAPYDRKYSHILNKLGIVCYDISLKPRSFNPLYDLITFSNYLYFFFKFKPKFFLPFTIKPNIYGSLASKFLKVNVINNITGLGSSVNIPLINSLIIILYKFSLSKKNYLLFQNAKIRDFFLSSSLVSDNKKYHIINGSGVDLSKFSFKKMTKSKLVFLMVARPIPEKGIIEYLDSAKKILLKKYNCEFHLITFLDREYNYKFIHKMISDYKKKNIITHFQATDDIKKRLYNSHCIVLPTYYNEGIPRILIEACATGRLIITTKFSDSFKILDEKKNGFFCKEKNVEDLTKKIEKILNLNNSEFMNFSLHSRFKAEKYFDENLIFNDYYTIINNHDFK